jgi:hypothetical protein
MTKIMPIDDPIARGTVMASVSAVRRSIAGKFWHSVGYALSHRQGADCRVAGKLASRRSNRIDTNNFR